MKVTYLDSDGGLHEVTAEGPDYEAAKTAAEAKLPEGAKLHAYWQV